MAIGTAVILAGGLSMRFAAGSDTPKALGRIGDQPILGHILDYFSRQGVERFIICTGLHSPQIQRWVTAQSGYRHRCTVLDTGENSSTAERLLSASALTGDETLLLSYCDVLSNIDLRALEHFHGRSGLPLTVAAVHPPEHYGRIEFNGNRVTRFVEKQPVANRWVNGGYFVVEPQALALIQPEDASWESGAVRRLADSGQLAAYKHTGFWASMETQKDRATLEQIYHSGSAPWKTDNATESTPAATGSTANLAALR